MRHLTENEQQLADKLTDAGLDQDEADEWVASVVNERVECVQAVHARIGAYRVAQTAIADLDREHIDPLAVGRILSDLHRAVITAYNTALDPSKGEQ